jgi:hypothetical protein
MSIWVLLGMVFVAGAIGGLVNNLIGNNGLLLPSKVDKGDGTSIFLPGFVGNLLVGAVAASVSWLLYGPLSQVSIGTPPGTAVMVLATLGGAVLVGMVGSAWLKNAVAKNVFQAAASQAAAASPSLDVSKRMLTASSVDALTMAKQLHTGTSTQPEPGVSIPA